MDGLRTWVKIVKSMSDDLETAVGRQRPNHLGPALVVDLGRVALEHLDRRPARAGGFLGRGLEGRARVDPPVAVVGAVGAHGRRHETGFIGRLEHRGAGAVAVEEDHRIVGVGELVHVVDPDHEHAS